MAEGVINLLQEAVTCFAHNEVSKATSAKLELDKLEQELKSIQPILRDAHTKQFTSKEVKEWILRLNDVAYDALDLIDLYRVHQRRDAEQSDSNHSKVRRTLHSFFKSGKRFYYLWEIGGKVKEINERLDVLFKEKDLYGLVPLAEGSDSVTNMREMWEGRQTTAAIIDSNIIGRGNDEDLVVGWLVQEPRVSAGSASIVAIVGMGGVGKTTLAKMILNNPTITKNFEKCLWVCVSEKPKLSDLFRKILEELDVKDCSASGQLIGLNSLRIRICEKLKGKRILLVLDDVWDHAWWHELRALLRVGSSGSKVMITTRNLGVANAIEYDNLHELSGLTEEQSWKLFVSKALRKGETEQELEGLCDIGKNIMRKCGGLPLALNTVGSLMRLKERRRYVWQDVLNSSFWNWRGPQDHNSFFSAIALSYMNIPISLKQCFTYCCMFPKDFPMQKDVLLRLWVAEGFIIKEEGIEMEVSAERSLESLVDCNLIQAEGRERYTLHDLVHDFALYIRGEEHVTIEAVDIGELPHNVRSFSSFGGECLLEPLAERRLRTFLCYNIGNLSFSKWDAFRWLRVLDLNWGNILELPESICELVLLRYLGLSGTKIFELPESIVNLCNLQTLDLSFCHVKRLPEKMFALVSLRHLDLRGAPLLDCLPKGIGKLTCLQTLSKFIVGSNCMDGRGITLQELKYLNNLRNCLEIDHLERVDCIKESQQAQLTYKENLQTLKLSCGSNSIREFNEEFSKKMEHVYEALQPPKNISLFSMRFYPGVRVPAWMHLTTFYSLEWISLVDCKFLEHFPLLAHLPKLTSLIVRRLESMKVLDMTFDPIGGIEVGFPKLKVIYLESMLNLVEWGIDLGSKTMPCLKSLIIQDCPKLRKIPFFLTLEKLRILGMANWEGWPMAEQRQFPSLKVLEVWNASLNLRSLPSCPVLEHLEINGCDELLEVPCSNAPSKVLIRNCSKACVSSPDVVCKVQNLTDLAIISSPRLAPLIDRLSDMKQLECLAIQGCSSLTSIPGDSHLTRLKNLTLRDLPRLDSLPLKLLDNIKGLEELHLGPNLGSVQVQGLLQCIQTARLKSLTLSRFQDLGMNWFKGSMFSMVCLEELIIEECPLFLSCVDLLKEHVLPNLRLLHIGSLRNDKLGGRSINLRLDFTCSFTINSVDMSIKLSGLVNWRNRVNNLSIRLMSCLDSLPEWIQQFDQLKCLVVTNSDGLVCLPMWLGKLPRLKYLELHCLPELEKLPDRIEGLCHLEQIYIYACPKLASLPDWVQHLPRLHALWITECDKLVDRCRKEDLHKISHMHSVRLQ